MLSSSQSSWRSWSQRSLDISATRQQPRYFYISGQIYLHCCLSLPDEPGGWQPPGDRGSTQRSLPGLPDCLISRLAGLPVNLGFHISLGVTSAVAESEEGAGRKQIRSKRNNDLKYNLL